MTVVVLASAKGSPGTTTTALALTTTWPLVNHPVPGKGSGKARGWRRCAGRYDRVSRVCLVDGDLAGSGVAAGYLRGGVPDGGGLVGFAIRGARLGSAAPVPEPVAFEESGRRAVLLGITDPAQARSVAPMLRPAVHALRERGDVLVDLGRLTTAADHDAVADVVDAADLALVVCRSTLASVSSARHLAARWRSAASRPGGRLRLGAIVVGAGPYPRSDVARALGVPVIAELTWDPASAAVFSDGAPPGWRFTHSALLRSARSAAHDLVHATSPTPSQTVAPGAAERAATRAAAEIDSAPTLLAREVARG